MCTFAGAQAVMISSIITAVSSPMTLYAQVQGYWISGFSGDKAGEMFTGIFMLTAYGFTLTPPMERRLPERKK